MTAFEIIPSILTSFAKMAAFYPAGTLTKKAFLPFEVFLWISLTPMILCGGGASITLPPNS